MAAPEDVDSSVGISIPAEPASRYYPSFPSSQHGGITDEEALVAQDVFQVWRPFEEEVGRRPEEPVFDWINILDDRFLLNQSGVSDILGRLPQPPLFQKPYKMTEIAHDFIRKQKRSIDLNKSLDKVSNRIFEFMKEQAIESEIIIDLEVDTEYDDWIEPRIRVLVEPSKFEQAYTLFDKLLDFSLKGIRKRETRRFIITLDTL